MAKKWEYREIIIHNEFDTEWKEEGSSVSGTGFEKVIDVLNLFGSQGWELVSIVETYYTFKRELAE